MKKSVIYISSNHNCYLYADKYNLSMLIHPELVNIIQGKSKDTYYSGKLKYLIRYGFFKSSYCDFATTIDESIVEDGIIHTKQIVFEVTNSCNFRCKYCVQGELYEIGGRDNPKKININAAFKLLRYVFDLKLKYNHKKITVSFYGGEPLANFESIVDYIENNYSDSELEVNYLMTTNASLIRNHIQYLVKHNFKLMISLDGDRYNDSYRVFHSNNEETFDAVTENIDLIRNSYPCYFESNVEFNSVIHNRNSVEEIYNYIIEKYGKIPKISELSVENLSNSEIDNFERIFKSKRKSENDFLLSESRLKDKVHKDSIKYRETIDYLKYYSINSCISDVRSLINNEVLSYPTNTCLPFSKKIFMDVSGNLYPCEKVYKKHKLGAVNDVVEINSKYIVDKLSYYYKDLKKVCCNCYINKFCGVCIFMNNIDPDNRRNNICDKFQDEKSFKEKLNRVFSFIENSPNDFKEILENTIITI